MRSRVSVAGSAVSTSRDRAIVQVGDAGTIAGTGVPEAIPIALSSTGRSVEVNPKLGHILISGGTGTGKSTVALSLMLNLALRGYCPVVINPLIVGYEPLEPLTDAIYFETEEALKALSATADEILARYRRARQRGLMEHIPSPDEPPIALLVEEAPVLTSTCPDRKLREAIMANLVKIANTGRKASVVMVVVTQQPSAEAISTAVRGACATKVGLRNDHIAWQALGADEEMLIRSQSVRLPGELLCSTPDYPGWQQGRSWLLSHEEALDIAETLAQMGTVPSRLPPHLDFEVPPKAPLFIR